MISIPVKALFNHTALFVVLAVICFLNGPLTAQSTMTALQRAEQRYQSLQTLQAEFTQTLNNPMLGEPAVTNGTIFLSPPSKFAMRFSNPNGDRVVCDGNWLWIYAPSSAANQVIKQSIPNRGAATPNLFAQFVERPLEHYMASYVGIDSVNGQTVDVVRLVPRRNDDPFTEAQIAVDRTTGMLLRLDVRELSGQRRILVFNQLRVDAAISDGEFRFDVPEGTRVIVP